MNQTRIKKSLFGLLAGGMLAAAFAFSEYAAYEPYTLSYNSTYAGSHEGIQAGWTLDNRGGNLRVSIAGGYDVLKDVSNLRGSSLYRDLNLMDEGVATLETSLLFREGFDGLKLVLTDSKKNVTYQLETDDGAFYLLEKDGRRIKLTQVEYAIIQLFMQNPGRALSREDILTSVWGREYDGELKIVDVNIRRLRIKIEDNTANPSYITTVWGYGYKWGL